MKKEEEKKGKRGEGGGIYTPGVRTCVCAWGCMGCPLGNTHFSTSPPQLFARQVQPTSHDY